MIEVLWHGRGGQGAFTAARLLGAAAMEAGAWALAFPSFGPERRGAPMRAFTKVAGEPIGDRSACAQADFVVYLDDTLLAEGWQAELKPGGRALVNTTRPLGDPRLLALDADGLSSAVFGRPIPNTAFLGALAQLGAGVGLADVEEAIRTSLPPRLHEGNLRVAREAFALVAVLLEGAGAPGLVGDAAGADGAAAAVGMADAAAPGSAEVCAAAQAPAAAGASGAPDLGRAAEVVRPERHISRLRSQAAAPPSLDPADFARSTCFAAGHLVTKNAGWRSQRPVIDAAACTACGQCILYCPDGCLYSACEPGANGAPQGPAIAVDQDFCKGCGICAKLCRFGAIAMVPEAEAEAEAARQAAAAPPGDDAPASARSEEVAA